jgi:hypothetical protein
MASVRSLSLVLAGLLAAAVLAACGSDESTVGESGQAAPEEQAASDEAALEHIHGLGVNPRDGTLYVATHTGLFRAGKKEAKIERVGDSLQDIMGFSVIGPDRFIGSGHPSPDQDLPPNLGLIESRDGGETWRNISLLGDADFHVLRSAGKTVYGFDGTKGRLMASGDGGASWKQKSPPAPVFDLAIDPDDDGHIVASTERGVFGSSDGGGTWRPLVSDRAGLLAWSDGEPLYLVDGDGNVSRSEDGGRQWSDAGGIGGQPVAFASADDALLVALPDGSVKRSTDSGATWTVRATP